MIILQKFGFKESRYERPQDKWVCGHLAEGKPCPLGPGGDGKCRVTTVCQPQMKDGRWECRRSSQDGGPCEDGPLPDGTCCKKLERCVPQSSLRAKRKRATWWAAALAVGLVALILGGGAANEYLMPGPLSQAHAVATNCQTCHAGVNVANLGWLHRFATAVSPLDNAKLCTTCHDVGKHPFTAHTSPVEQLRAMTAALKADPQNQPPRNDSWVQKIAFPVPDIKSATGEPEIFCSTCHKEHKGAFNKLTTVSDDICQTCHVSKFGSFAQSHPQFSQYPFNRRTRIIFNHKSHFGKYFPQAVQAATAGQVVPTVCSDCHVPGAGQKYMEIRSYDSMCSSCHNGDISGANVAMGPKGIDFIAVPGLDVATLAERGIDIGEWPENSEAGLTAFMRTLLASQKDGKDIVNGVAGLDLLDLSKASDATLAKVKAFGWAVKRLLHNLESTNMSAAMDMSKEAAKQQMAGLTGGISHAVIVEADRTWFPNLDDDLMRHDQGKPTKSFVPPAAEKKAPADQSKAKQSGEDKSTTEKSTSSDNSAILPPANDNKSADILSPGSDNNAAILPPANDNKSADILSPGSDNNAAILPPANDNKNADILSPGSDNNAAILPPANDNNNAAILPPSSDNNAAILPQGNDNGSSDILSPDNNSTKEKAGNLLGVDTENASEPTKTEPVKTPFNAETYAEYGGWYRQDFTIRYRPTGHADMFLHTWLDFAGHAYDTAKESQFTPVFDQLARKDSIGRCTKCHSVDDDHGGKIVNWLAFDPTGVKTRFTKFSHAPHIEMAGTEGCVTCHALTKTGSDDYLKTYAGGDPHVFSQNFVSLKKSLCATCHTAQTAGENCTKCHNYHFTEFSRPLIKTKLP